jgi:glycosyltransferase involved in cell wall biosynthesis
MYSILIPTYNYRVSELVNELYRQAKELLLDFEIIILEDGSELYVEENSALQCIDNLRYLQFHTNIGRSAARNRLAVEARFPYLIFMDCDAAVHHDDFLRRYANFFRDENVVVVGGTAYDSAKNDQLYSLRLKYGRKREANLLYLNRKDGYNNFATFNFLISKNIFQKIGFDESIKGYGHEDTLFGHALRISGYVFFRIDNSLLHQGLEDNVLFLRKTRESTENLFRLYQSGNYPFLSDESHLLKMYIKLKKKNLCNLIAYMGILLNPFLQWQLRSKYPSLVLYDFYKLTVLCDFARKH